MNPIALRWFLMMALSFIFMLLPFPQALSSMMPPWPLLVFFYTGMFWGMAWMWMPILLVGLMMDVMQVTVLGDHVLALTCGLWIMKLNPHLFRYCSMNKQMFWVGVVSMGYLMTLFLLESLHSASLSWQFFIQICFSACLSVMCWPGIKIAFDRVFTLANPALIKNKY